jgi:hypothetical protein
MGGQMIGSLPVAAIVRVTGKATDASGAVWYQIDGSSVHFEAGSQIMPGWVVGDIVVLGGPCDAVPEVK